MWLYFLSRELEYSFGTSMALAFSSYPCVVSMMVDREHAQALFEWHCFYYLRATHYIWTSFLKLCKNRFLWSGFTPHQQVKVIRKPSTKKASGVHPCIISGTSGRALFQARVDVHYFRHEQTPEWNHWRSISLRDSFLIWRNPKSLAGFELTAVRDRWF